MWGLELVETKSSQRQLAVSALSGLAGITGREATPPPPVHECIPPLAAALAANRTLTWLRCETELVFKPPAALAMVLTALTSHPSLRVLELQVTKYSNWPRDAAAMGALCALVVANAPALRELNIEGAALRDDVRAQLLDAVAHNTHLRVVNLGDSPAM